MKCNDNSTCLLGSHFDESYALFRQIVKNQTPVLLALDPDARLKTHDIAKLLSTYGIEVRILGDHSFEDVGDMTKKDFSALKLSASKWKSSDRLYNLINGIRSGTLL